MVNVSKLVWGDYVYPVDNITSNEIVDNDSYDETVLVLKGTKGRVVATPSAECVIVFFEPDKILFLYPYSITKDENSESIHRCPVCGTYNSLKEIIEGCKECGVPSDPGTGVIGSDDEEPEEF